jgi:hypothetical protein
LSGEGFGFSDDAKRMCDEINVHYHALGAESIFRWVAVRLSDGGTDHVLYDTRADAVTHQSDSRLCLYIQIPPTGATARECESVLRFGRFAFDHGYKIVDPTDPALIMPNSREDLERMFQGR